MTCVIYYPSFTLHLIKEVNNSIHTSLVIKHRHLFTFKSWEKYFSYRCHPSVTGLQRLSSSANLSNEKLLKSSLADDTATFLLEGILLLRNSFNKNVLLLSSLNVLLYFFAAFGCLRWQGTGIETVLFIPVKMIGTCGVINCNSRLYEVMFMYLCIQMFMRSFLSSEVIWVWRTYQPPLQFYFILQLVNLHQGFVFVCQLLYIDDWHFLLKKE